jgi:hypothetical protein
LAPGSESKKYREIETDSDPDPDPEKGNSFKGGVRIFKFFTAVT